ncbi:Hypothetical protein A7982_07811 [Minicystis rosea]|nr:Hypothetical protein A7982_07811 [Minicystis rosea]
MSLGRFDKRIAVLVAAGAAFATTLATSGDAAAAGPVTPTGKGIVGGALLGGEVVTITMGAAGVSRGWPYFVFGGLGAVGGGIGGYFVEKATKGTTDASGNTTGGTAEPALYMLAGGMALLIPALVVSLNATAYKPPESDRVEPAGNEPSKDAPKVTPPGAAPPPGTTKLDKKKRPSREYAAIPHVPVSIVDVYKGKIALGLPALEVRPLYSQSEMWKYGVTQGTEVRFPVFKSMF